jgi:hypothetical protein
VLILDNVSSGYASRSYALIVDVLIRRKRRFDTGFSL